MRYLNKIVFINSASVKYAEINLDGNVHFIGTQGVGKSTLLRAILFFYNADKTKLGIPREKQNFDEYYFPYQNSYLIYEVAVDKNYYTVLAFKTQGRTAFRFIDAAYNKNFFIDKNGRAYETFDKIREALGKNIHAGKIINNYEQFRDIIYGNNKSLKSEYRKYALIESKQYQNIPRTIQNVFLNSKLDAHFIKETIIKSLNEEEIKIDLKTYSKSHLREFELEFNDLRKWNECNKKGEYPVQKQAQKVLSLFQAHNYLINENQNLSKQLLWRINFVNKEKPALEHRFKDELLNRKMLYEQIEKADKLYNNRVQKIVSKIDFIDNQLKKSSEQKKHYQAINIKEIISRVEQKPFLEKEKEDLRQQKDILSAQFIDIEEKYKTLNDKIKNQFEYFKNRSIDSKNAKEREFFHLKDEINEKYHQIIEEIRTQHKEELDAIRNKIGIIKEEIAKEEQEKTKIRYQELFKQEIENIEIEILQLTDSKRNYETAKQKSENEIVNIRKNWEFDNKNTENEIKRQIEEKNKEIKQRENEISKIKQKLESEKDTFYEWLNTNVSHWTETIGKVIDEEHVLFKTGLSPQKTNENQNSFYGVKINVNNIEKSVKSIDDYKKELEDYKAQIIRLQKEIAGLETRLNDELKKHKRKYQEKINEHQKKIRQFAYEIDKADTRLQKLEIEKNELKKKAEERKKEKLQVVQNKINKANENLIKTENLYEKTEKNINRQISLKEKEKKQLIAEAKSKLDSELKEIDIAIKKKKEETDTELAQIKQNLDKELKNKGADTEKINLLESKIAEIEQELIFIENNRDKVVEYRKDKRELFDKEADFKRERAKLTKQKDAESEKHETDKQKLNNKLSVLNDLIKNLEEKLKEYEQDLDKFEDFKKSDISNHLLFENYEADEKYKTTSTALKIIEQINQKYYESRERFDEFKTAIHRFTGNFSENNIFKFETQFQHSSDYIEFAENLENFIKNDVASEVEKRINERFATIIKQIGKETNEILSKEGEIEDVIRKINKDFSAKNFVGAIKSMEMRTVKSSNKIMNLLIEISRFNEENALTLGERNLFSVHDTDKKNEQAIRLLQQLTKEMENYKSDYITLSDSFGIKFRIMENNNDTGWQEKLSNVGSEGTDVLIKAMINIMLLNVFKENASKKFKDFKLHCMMDEIGKLHPNNVKGILKFANDRNILLINGSPTSYNASDYKHTYLLSKDEQSITRVKRLVSLNT